jgi:hypothetical protein
MQEDRIALSNEFGIFHRIPPLEENDHFVIGRSCRCCPTLEIVDEKTVIVDHKKIMPPPMINPLESLLRKS